MIIVISSSSSSSSNSSSVIISMIINISIIGRAWRWPSRFQLISAPTLTGGKTSLELGLGCCRSFGFVLFTMAGWP